MGALTTNRKRGNDFFNLSYFSSPSSISEYDFHQVSKKPRVSYVNLSPETPVSPVASKSSVSRIHRYPEPTQRFRREVHAPCRKPKFFGSGNLSGEARSDDMGIFLSRQYEQAKSIALDTLQNFRKGKGVIEEEAQCSKDVISDDSSVEELEILDNVDNGLEEGRSVVSEQRSLETRGDAYLHEKYAKFADYHPGASSSGATDLVNQRPELDDTEKMLESMSVNRVLKEMGVPPHKKLYESAERRNSKLGFLAFQIDLVTKKLSFLPRPSKKPEEEETFTPLTDEEEDEVSIALSNANRRRVLATHENSNIQITGEIMQCLRPGAWLNDEAINVYLELLKERENREPKKFLKCHFFNTFFYKKLISGKGGYDFKAVRRWTTQRKIGYGLIECDKIFVPIHKEIHWCLAVINKKEEKFQYLDSLKGMDTKVLKVLVVQAFVSVFSDLLCCIRQLYSNEDADVMAELLSRYFAEEVKDKSGKEIDVSSWKHEYVDDLPEQENGWDCGVFMIKYADFYSRGLGLSFNQEHMPYFRRRTAKEILRLKAE